MSSSRILLIVGAVLVCVCLLSGPFFIETVEAGHEGVVTSFGKVQQRSLSPGLNFVWPWQNIIPVNVQVKNKTIHASVFSTDLQEGQVEISLNYRPIRGETFRLYEEYGLDGWLKDVVEPALHESLKAATAKHTAEDIIANRDVVNQAITDNLKARLAKAYVELVQYSVVNFEFSPKFKAAVEAKQIEAQAALEQHNKVQREKYLADQEVQKARGESARLTSKAEALKESPGVIVLSAIEAWAAGGSKVPNTLILGGTEIQQLMGVLKTTPLVTDKEKTE